MAIIGGSGIFPRISELRDIVNVNCPTRTDGDILRWNDALQLWECTSLAGGLTPHALTDHTNVDTTGQTDGDCLCLSGGTWVPVNPDTIVGAATIDLNDLNNVVVPTPSTNDCLCYDGINWVPTSPASIAAGIDLDDLADVNVGTPGAPEDGYALAWDNGTGQYTLQNISGGGGATDLDGLTDVTITAAANGQILRNNGAGQWVNVAPSLIGADINFGDLGDIDLTGLVDGQGIAYNLSSGNWEPVTLSGGGGTVGGTGVAGQVAFWTSGTNIGGEVEFLYSSANNRMQIGTSNQNFGAVNLETGSAGGIAWPGDFGVPLAFYGDTTSGTIGDGAFHFHTRFGTSFIVGDVDQAFDRELRLQAKGTGTLDVGIEGGLQLFNGSNFSTTPATIGTDVSLGFTDNFYMAWPGGGNARDFGWRQSNGEWIFGRGTGGEIRMACTDPLNSGARLQWRLGTPSTETVAPGDVNIEGVLYVHDDLGYGATFPSAGLIRLARPTAPDGTFAGIYGQGDNTVVTNDVPLIGVRRGSTRTWINNTDAWPSAAASGYLANNGSGDLSWSTAAVIGGSIDLDDLQDVTAPSPTTNDLLEWNGAAWVNISPASMAGNFDIADINDVTITTPANGEVLTYNGSIWVNQAIPAIALDDLSDVVITTPANPSYLKYTGTNWVDIPLSTLISDVESGISLALDDLTDVSTGGASTGEVMQYDGANWTPSGVRASRSLAGYFERNGLGNLVNINGSGYNLSGTANVTVTPTTAFPAGSICIMTSVEIVGATRTPRLQFSLGGASFGTFSVFGGGGNSSENTFVITGNLD